MIELNGKYGNTKIFNDYVEEAAMSQVINLINDPVAKNTKIRFMSDVHAGEGCTIGTTMILSDKVVPSFVGVDIGCGVLAYRITGIDDANLKEIDKAIRENIPHGRNVGNFNRALFESVSGFVSKDFLDEIKEICNRTGQSYAYVLDSLGTLGGGNHYIEIDKGKEDSYLMVHSGSRNFGKNIAEYHQNIANKNFSIDAKVAKDKASLIEEYKSKGRQKEIAEALKKLEVQTRAKYKAHTQFPYLVGKEMKAYLHDMKIAQEYAKINRRMIADIIIKRTELYYSGFKIESVHNYIETHRIGGIGYRVDVEFLRKGAISAYTDETVLIPLNMRDGTLIGYGKGNEDWNYSAPHGAGRLMSRRKAKETVDLEEYKETMKEAGIFSTCVNEHTLDESPFAYKDAEEIKMYVEDTIELIDHVKPIYNFKSDN